MTIRGLYIFKWTTIDKKSL